MRVRDLVSAVAALAAAAVAIFALGGAPRWAQAIVAVLLAIALAALVPSRHVLGRMSPLVAVLGIAAVLTAIQLLPLPHALVAALDPTGTGLRDDGTALLGVDARSTITLDEPGSLRALAYFAILLAVAVVALRASVSERARFRVLAAVAVLCGLVAAVVGVHVVLAARELYGVYAPIHTSPHLLGPLINTNHLGCLMALGAGVSIGLAMYRRQPAVLRVLWLAIVAGCGTVALLSASRGAALGLGAGAFVALAVLVGQRFLVTDPRTRTRFAANSLSISVVAACAVVIVLYASAGGIAEQFQQTSLQEVKMPRTKFAAWRSAGTLVQESPWVGVGRGAFEAAFTRVHPASAFLKFSNVENEYLQAVVDWGVPGAIVLGLAGAWCLATALRRWRDGPLAAGALGGMAAVLLQSNVDFGVEMLGIAIPMTAVAATMMYVPLRDPAPGALGRARGLRLAHVVALAACALLLASARTTSIEEDDRALATHPSLDDVKAAVARHPLDYFAYRTAAEIMIGTKGGDRAAAVAVLNHAMRLHPTEPGLHLTAARLLVGAGRRDQAAHEYTLAMSATADRRMLIAEVVKNFPPDEAAAAITIDDNRIDETIAVLRELRRLDVAIAWLERVIRHSPDNARPCEILFGLAMPSADPRIVAVANKSCRAIESTHQQRVALARAMLADHHAEEIVGLLGDVDQWRGRVDDKIDAWFLLCDAYRDLEQFAEAKHCLRRLDASGALAPARAAEVQQRLAAVERQRLQSATGSGSAARP